MVQIWSFPDGILQKTLKGHNGWVNDVAFSPDGTILASGSEDGTIRLWKISDNSILHTIQAHVDWGVNSIAFSPDGTLLATGSVDKTVKLWRVSDGTLLNTLEKTGGAESINFSRDDTLIALGAWDGTIRLYGVTR